MAAYSGSPTANNELDSLNQQDGFKTSAAYSISGVKDGFERTFEINPVTLTFRSPAVEGEYLADVAKRRWPVLIFIFCFDVVCYVFRIASKCVNISAGTGGPQLKFVALQDVLRDMGPQLANMVALYLVVGLLNRRSRKQGNNAARQEELMLSALMSLAICALTASLKADTAGDYVYVAYFLICTSTFLKIRWWVGTLILAAPAALAQFVHRAVQSVPSNPILPSVLPPDGVVHIVVAWAVGGLMAYLADWYRRQMFASQKLAALAHSKELLEAKARIKAQRELAAAQAQAAARALTVAREKASNEAKSEFMSLMCHEVRTPLNGCLASAEMLLETPLEDEQRELAKTIRVSGSILLSTVSNFLDFFKMEAGKALDIVRCELRLEELVSDVHCIIEAMLGRSGDVQLLPPDLSGVPEVIYGDPDRLRGVLLNLYTNAAKFTKSGHILMRLRTVEPDYVPTPPPNFSSVTVTPSYMPWRRGSTAATPRMSMDVVASGALAAAASRLHRGSSDLDLSSLAAQAEFCRQLSTVSDGGMDQPPSRAAIEEAVRTMEPRVHGSDATQWLLFEVADTGVGIGEAGLRALFQEFVQGTEDEMRKPRSKGGTGLGLSICSKQVGVLGGRIGAHSAVGQGSVFWFTVPLVLPPRLQAQPMRSSSSSNPLHRLASMPHSHSSHEDDGSRGASLTRPLPHNTSTGDLTSISEQHATPNEPPQASSSASSTMPATGRGDSGVRQEVWHAAASDLMHGLATSSPDGSRPGSPGPGLGGTGQLAGSTGGLSGGTGGTGPPAMADSPRGPAAAGSALMAAGQPPPSPPLQDPPRRQSIDRRRSWPNHSSGDDGSEAGVAVLVRQCSDQVGAGNGAGAGTSAQPNGTGWLPPGCGDGLAAPRNNRTSLDGRRQVSDWSFLKGLRVLLAEDNLINQTVARKMLKSLGMECEVASNGLEAVKAVQEAHNRQHQFDVVLMDMAMPVMGGVEATRGIRTSGCPVPILAMTANASDKDRDECMDAGMDGFLSKPVLKDRLAEAIAGVIGGRAWFKEQGLPLKALDRH